MQSLGVEALDDEYRESAYYCMGLAKFYMSSIDESESYFNLGLRISKTPYRFYEALGNLYSMTGRYGRARDALDKAVELCDDPQERSHVLCFYGHILNEAGKHIKAIEKFLDAVAVDPYNEDAYYYLGHMQQQMRLFGEAEYNYREALKIDPFDVDVRINLGNTLCDTGRPIEAIEEYRYVTEIHPRCASAYYNWSVILYALGQIDEALAKAQKAMQLDPFDPRNPAQVGFVELSLGRPERASDLFEAAVELGSEDARTFADFAEALILIGKRKQALEILREGATLFDNQAPVDGIRAFIADEREHVNVYEIVVLGKYNVMGAFTRTFTIHAENLDEALKFCKLCDIREIARSYEIVDSRLLVSQISSSAGPVVAGDRVPVKDDEHPKSFEDKFAPPDHLHKELWAS
ncbi:MAG: tetratricopeptide repeat protein [Planctomycetes bacterium]|nr:tetratricopeptide repeat protein [Planctomycetota bacterium]